MKRICFIKEFTYLNPNNARLCKFERMKRYNLPEVYADWFLENKYAFEYGYAHELESKPIKFIPAGLDNSKPDIQTTKVKLEEKRP